MDFGNENLMKPLLYRDIMGPENTPMGAANGCGIYGPGGMYGAGYMGGMYPTNLLGGVTMQPGLTQDTYQNLQYRQKKDFSFMKYTLLTIGAIGALGLMKFKGGNLWSKITNFFKKTPAAPTPAPTAPKGWWKKVTGWFRR